MVKPGTSIEEVVGHWSNDLSFGSRSNVDEAGIDVLVAAYHWRKLVLQVSALGHDVN